MGVEDVNAIPSKRGPRAESVTFPNDHVVETLRGYRTPTAPQIKKAIASRCAWLVKRIERAVIEQRFVVENSFEMHELAALVKLVEIAEAHGWREAKDPNRERWSCGHYADEHPNHGNLLAGAAERDGRTCRLGWPL